MTILKVEDISKLYRIGVIGSGTLREDLAHVWAKLRGKTEALRPVSDANQRYVLDSQHIWALSNVSFDVKKGEAISLIGKNGAGKSTLLRILSRVTKPTLGKVYLNGKVSSMLGIGTGFHLELTGRENIYLSGAILGMSLTQIRRRYKDIVTFAGMERFIDTPVKRYSSGMYLRLGFSVAAHLDSDILIMDEILAVGDHEFRNHALDRMNKLVKEGKTVIYVSHQFQSVRRLCTRGVLLEKGKVSKIGDIEDVLRSYTGDVKEDSAVFTFSEPINVKESKGYIERLTILDEHGEPCAVPCCEEKWKIKVDFKINRPLERFKIILQIKTPMGDLVNSTYSRVGRIDAGQHTALFEANHFSLGPEAYKITMSLSAHAGVFEVLHDKATLHLSDVSHKKGEDMLSSGALVTTPLDVDILSA